MFRSPRCLARFATIRASPRTPAYECAKPESLGYIPSRRGSILAAGSTGQVAVVVTDLANPFFSEAIEHLNHALYEAELRAVVHTDSAEHPVVPERCWTVSWTRRSS